MLCNAHAFFDLCMASRDGWEVKFESFLASECVVKFTGSDLAYQKELIGDFSLILGANSGHHQNFEGKFLILLILRDWFM